MSAFACDSRFKENGVRCDVSSVKCAVSGFGWSGNFFRLCFLFILSIWFETFGGWVSVSHTISYCSFRGPDPWIQCDSGLASMRPKRTKDDWLELEMNERNGMEILCSHSGVHRGFNHVNVLVVVVVSGWKWLILVFSFQATLYSVVFFVDSRNYKPEFTNLLVFSFIAECSHFPRSTIGRARSGRIPSDGLLLSNPFDREWFHLHRCCFQFDSGTFLGIQINEQYSVSTKPNRGRQGLRHWECSCSSVCLLPESAFNFRGAKCVAKCIPRGQIV